MGGTNDDGANAIHQTSDGGYIVAGFSKSNDGDVTGHQGNTTTDDNWIVKLDGNGNIQWQKSLGGTLNDVANSINQSSDGGYITAGSSSSNDGDVSGNHGSNDYWVVKLSSFIGITENLKGEIIISLSPNPATEELSINLSEQNKDAVMEMYNVTGELTRRWLLDSGNQKKKIDIKNLPAGIYFVKIISGERMVVRKVVKM